MMPTATTHRLGALSFVVTFHAPFHVGSGVASRGLDRVIDRENPLPATGLKGVMRAAAAETLDLPTGLVTEVFGGPGGAACPWWWSDARFIPQETSIDRLARIRVEEADLPALAREFTAILGFIEQLNEVDVDGVEPMTSVTPMRLKRRGDAVTDGGYPAKILANAPDAREGFFAVPKVVE